MLLSWFCRCSPNRRGVRRQNWWQRFSKAGTTTEEFPFELKPLSQGARDKQWGLQFKHQNLAKALKQLLLLTGCLEVSLWWNRATRPNTSWQYRWSSSNSSSIRVASKGSLFWINCSPKTISWSILLVFSVISCWKPYLEHRRKIITSAIPLSSLRFVLLFSLTVVKEK